MACGPGKVFRRTGAAMVMTGPLTAATSPDLGVEKWVGENQKEAAQMSVDKKYIASSVEINAQALVKLRYLPGVASCRKSVTSAAAEMKLAGLLQPTTDPEKLTERAWMDLDGVNDEWLKDLKVGQGSRPRLLDPVEFAALFEKKSCCGSCCCLQE